jgi:hypothetical protein
MNVSRYGDNPRYLVEVGVVVKHPRSVRKIQCELSDLSPGGCRLVTNEPFAAGDQLLVKLEGLEFWPGSVSWVGTGFVGLAFHVPLNNFVVEHYARRFPSGVGVSEHGRA